MSLEVEHGDLALGRQGRRRRDQGKKNNGKKSCLPDQLGSTRDGG
ncbi:hypothetical protein [Jiella pelagia]|nr:hypothetical protein [Jiella pelagia]